jgi:hypothetical protein
MNAIAMNMIFFMGWVLKMEEILSSKMNYKDTEILSAHQFVSVKGECCQPRFDGRTVKRGSGSRYL